MFNVKSRRWGCLVTWFCCHLIANQGLYSLSGKTSYCKISWSLEAVIFGFGLYQSLWNLRGTSAALLPKCLSNFRAIRPLYHPISWLRDFTRFVGKTSYRLVKRGPGNKTNPLSWPRLLHSPSLVAVGLSVGYAPWPPIGWHHSFVIGWSKYRLGLPSAPLHYGLTWPVGIPTVFQTPVTVLLHCPNGRQLGLCKAKKGTVKESVRDLTFFSWHFWFREIIEHICL